MHRESTMGVPRERDDSALRQLRQPNQNRLLIDAPSLEVLTEMAQHAGGDDIRTPLVVMIAVQMKALLPARGLEAAKLAGARTGAILRRTKAGPGVKA